LRRPNCFVKCEGQSLREGSGGEKQGRSIKGDAEDVETINLKPLPLRYSLPPPLQCILGACVSISRASSNITYILGVGRPLPLSHTHSHTQVTPFCSRVYTCGVKQSEHNTTNTQNHNRHWHRHCLTCVSLTTTCARAMGATSERSPVAKLSAMAELRPSSVRYLARSGDEQRFSGG
jgi:hypothetical protein